MKIKLLQLFSSSSRIIGILLASLSCIGFLLRSIIDVMPDSRMLFQFSLVLGLTVINFSRNRNSYDFYSTLKQQSAFISIATVLSLILSYSLVIMIFRIENSLSPLLIGYLFNSVMLVSETVLQIINSKTPIVTHDSSSKGIKLSLSNYLNWVFFVTLALSSMFLFF